MEEKEQDEWLDESWNDNSDSVNVEIEDILKKPKKKAKSEDAKQKKAEKEELRREQKEVKEVVAQKKVKRVSKEVESEPAAESAVGNDQGVWKVLTIVFALFLIASLLTGGFRSFNSSRPSEADAGKKAIDFINGVNPSLAPQLRSSTDIGDVYQLNLTVSGREVVSYLTKDGRWFFPYEAVDLSLPPPTEQAGAQDVQGAPIGSNAPAEVSTDDDAVLGNPEAPITIIEFSDFQCPFCRTFWRDTMPDLKAKYIDTGKAKLVFRDFPLSFHPNAFSGALAAECAHDQDKFWEMHDKIFEEQEVKGQGTIDFTNDDLKNWAADIGLNALQFNDCMDTLKYKSEVESDQNDGLTAGVTGTPTFFVNGEVLTGSLPFSAFEEIMEKKLTESQEAAVVVQPVEQPEPATEVKAAGNVAISITAKKFRFDPAGAKVRKGSNVQLVIKSSDADMRFVLPEYGVDLDLNPSETVKAEFLASREGAFTYTCSECDGKETVMKGTLTVE